MKTLLWPLINFTLLFGYLGFKLKRPVAEFVFGRHVQLKKEIADVAQDLKSTQKKAEEVDLRMKRLEAETQSLKAGFVTDATSAAARVIKTAKEAADSLSRDAVKNTQTALTDAKRTLVSELGKQVVAKAEATIVARLTGDDRVRVRKGFSSELENLK